MSKSIEAAAVQKDPDDNVHDSTTIIYIHIHIHVYVCLYTNIYVYLVVSDTYRYSLLYVPAKQCVDVVNNDA